LVAGGAVYVFVPRLPKLLRASATSIATTEKPAAKATTRADKRENDIGFPSSERWLTMNHKTSECI
jgi:hypothetical protein